MHQPGVEQQGPRTVATAGTWLRQDPDQSLVRAETHYAFVHHSLLAGSLDEAHNGPDALLRQQDTPEGVGIIPAAGHRDGAQGDVSTILPK